MVRRLGAVAVVPSHFLFLYHNKPKLHVWPGVCIATKRPFLFFRMGKILRTLCFNFYNYHFFNWKLAKGIF